MTEIMVENQTVQVLFEKAQRGDREAFQELVERFGERLQGQIRARMGRRVRGRFEVQDFYQETLLRAFSSISYASWRGDELFYRWLASIAEHLISDAAQKKALTELTLQENDAATEISPAKQLRREERFERLEKAFHHLSADERKALALSRLEGRKIREVAAAMGRSPEAVRKLIARAAIRLKKKFGDTESLHLPDKKLDVDGTDHD